MPSSEKRNKKGWLTVDSLQNGHVEERVLGRYVVRMMVERYSQAKGGTFYVEVRQKPTPTTWMWSNQLTSTDDFGRHRKYLSARHRFLYLVDKYTLIAAREALGIETND